MHRSLRAIAACGILSGCYTYTPVDVATAPPQASVRARLSAPAAARVASSLSGGDGRLVSGIVVENQTNALTLEVPTVPMGTATAQQGLFQRVTIARGEILELEDRRLDKQRTGLLIGATAVGVGVITAAIIHGQSTGANAPTEPPSNFLRRFAFTFRF